MNMDSIKGKLEELICVHDLDVDSASLVENAETYPYLDSCPVNWSQGKTGTNTISTYRTSQFLALNNLIEDTDFETHPLQISFKNVFTEFDAKIIQYREQHGLHLNKDELWGINKYGVGSEYKDHYDHGPNSPRLLSGVMFLNDDFDGGELVFPYFEKSIEPKAGRLVLFPSSFIYRHVSVPVVEGVKYSLVTWLV